MINIPALHIIVHVTLSAKTHIVHTSMHIEKKRNLKIICEITHATGKYLQGLMGPAKPEINKDYIPSYSPGYEKFKIFVSFP